MVLIREQLGGVFRDARKRQGLTLSVVSESARVSQGYISELERGLKEPSSEVINNLARAYGMTLSEVLFEVGTRVAELEDVRVVPRAASVQPELARIDPTLRAPESIPADFDFARGMVGLEDMPDLDLVLPEAPADFSVDSLDPADFSR
ncbi:transcriptional regulator with XRE-family HTH domain [Microbacteriaceae bacterium MWH-Ta3]|nr:transcriptional regulator with XRE-family HTH domain [Microbacteriaceae bacterium MWH-Ta3]